MGLLDLFKSKKEACKVCKKGIDKKQLNYKGHKFCCKTCCDKFKKSEKNHVCEYC